MNGRRVAGGVVVLGLMVAATWWFLSDDAATSGNDDVQASALDSAESHDVHHEPKPSSWTTVAPAKGALEVTGVVRDAKGPVAGAIVTATAQHGAEVLSDLPCQCDNHCGLKLLECGCPEAAGQLLEFVATRTGEAPPLARATSDAEGRFVLTGLIDEPLAVWADAPTGIALNTNVKAGGSPVELLLTAGRTLTGTVAGTTGAPIAGSLVTAIFAAQSRFFDAVTDAKGTFHLGPLPKGQYSVVAATEGLLPDHHQVRADDDEPIELTLATPRALAGVVTRNGAPLAGALVKIDGQHRKRKTTSDEKGRFHFERLRAGEYTVSATSQGAAGSTTANVLPSRDLAGVALELGPAVQWAGVVVDDQQGPIEGAKVFVTRDAEGTDGWTQATSDAAGRFTLPPLATGKYRVYATARGFLDPEYRSEPLSETPTELRFVLTRAVSIAGVVVDAAGTSLDGVTVTASAPRTEDNEEDYSRPQTTDRTADGGVFTLFVKPGSWRLSAALPGFIGAEVESVAPADNVRLVLSPGATISGLVLEPDGGPSTAEVSRVLPPAERTRAQAMRPNNYDSVRTDADGHFEMKGVPPGKWRLTANHRVSRMGSSASMDGPTAELTIADGQQETVTLRFKAALSLAGRVVRADGAPARDVIVRVQQGPDLHAMARTAHDGSFSVTDVRPGSVSVLAHGNDGTKAEVTAQAGDTALLVLLSGGAYAAGRVLDDQGAPLAEFKIDSSPFTAEDGRFRVPVYERRRLVFDARGFAQHAVELKNPDGPNELGDIVLSRGGALAGQVIDGATKQPVVGALVDVGSNAIDGTPKQFALSESHGAVKTDAKGHFTLDHVEASVDKIYVTHADYIPYQAPIGSTRTVTVSLTHGLSLTVDVRDRAGQSIKMPVFAKNADQRMEAAKPGANGALVFTGLSSGEWTVTAYDQRRIFRPLKVSLSKDQ
ncbi:MAG: carboxypeptidase regulatory-like domain-containing protein, partial [Archangium sp.]|nr:carboxypeptidase regulatory-like domain-containing protein [Archangium sp.]